MPGTITENHSTGSAAEDEKPHTMYEIQEVGSGTILPPELPGERSSRTAELP
jgi:hypothetical protein